MKRALVEATSKANDTHITGIARVFRAPGKIKGLESLCPRSSKRYLSHSTGGITTGANVRREPLPILRILFVFCFESSLFKSSVWCENATLVEAGKNKNQIVNKEK